MLKSVADSVTRYRISRPINSPLHRDASYAAKQSLPRYLRASPQTRSFNHISRVTTQQRARSFPQSRTMSTAPDLSQYDKEIVDIANYVHDYKIDSKLAVSPTQPPTSSTIEPHRLPFPPLPVRHRPLRLPRHPRLRPRSAQVPRVHTAARPDGPRHSRPPRRQDPWHGAHPRPRHGRLLHRHHDPLARLQRLLARSRMGPPVRQPRRDPGRRRLAHAHRSIRW